MNTIELTIAGNEVAPAAAAYMYAQSGRPDPKPFTLKIMQSGVHQGLLKDAALTPTEHPTEEQVRHWIYYLPSIVFGVHDVESAGRMPWVIFDIDAVSESDGVLIIRGQCALFD